jgi:hypothetical protein
MRLGLSNRPTVGNTDGRSVWQAENAKPEKSGGPDMGVGKRIANGFGMDGEAWRRHANPWSVYTRFAAIPAAALAVWSRTWIGWWCLVPLALVVVWLFLNVRVFSPVGPTSWTAKGIYGERLWLLDRQQMPSGHRAVVGRLILLGLCGFALMAWGLYRLEVWPTLFGMVLVVVAQLWRIDRFSLLYEERERLGTA